MTLDQGKKKKKLITSAKHVMRLVINKPSPKETNHRLIRMMVIFL